MTVTRTSSDRTKLHSIRMWKQRYSVLTVSRYESRNLYYAGSQRHFSVVSSEGTRITADSTSSYDRVERLVGGYFDDLLTATSAMTTAYGEYYSNSIGAIQTNFDANSLRSESLDGTLLSKATSYTNSLISTETSLNTSILNSVYGYANATSNSSTTTSAESAAAIDAKIAYYRTVQNAKTTAAKKNIRANHDAITRQINFLASWAQYSNSVNDSTSISAATPSQNISVASHSYYWGPDYYYYYGYGYSYYSYDDLYGYGGLYVGYGATGESPETGYFYDGYAGSFAGVGLRGFSGSGNPWQTFNTMNSSLRQSQWQSANLAYEAAESGAKYTYITTYASLYNGQVGDQLDGLESEFTAAINAGRSLNTGLWNAVEGANNSVYGVTRSTDTTHDILGYLSLGVKSNITLSTSLVNYFGAFQTNWRSDRLDSGNVTPRYSQYLEDAAWTNSMRTARNEYYDLLGGTINDYNDTIFEELGNYADSSLEALIAKSTAYFTANRGYSESGYENMAAYQTAQFGAAKGQSQSYLDAAIAELVSNAEAEKTAKEQRSSDYDSVLGTNNAALNDNWNMNSQRNRPEPNFDLTTEEGRAARAVWLANEARQGSENFTTFLNTAPNISTNLETLRTNQTAVQRTMENTIAVAKTTNENTRKDAEEVADESYRLSVRQAYNTYIATKAGIENTFKTSISAADETYKTAQATISATFDAAAEAAQSTLETTATGLTGRFGQAIQAINEGESYQPGYVENENIDLKVCFVAGTPILMADGTTKPIEQIRPGDMVLAVDHNDPENDTPKPARVTRFFDNGSKEVVKLTFENQETGEQFEVVCTPSHRFYVKNKGWVNAVSLQTGEQCISAKETEITFISHEELQIHQCVYNFEVEEKHTYFVGMTSSASMLVHNVCPLDSSEFPLQNEISQYYNQVSPSSLQDAFTQCLQGRIISDLLKEKYGIVTNDVYDLKDYSLLKPLEKVWQNLMPDAYDAYTWTNPADALTTQDIPSPFDGNYITSVVYDIFRNFIALLVFKGLERSKRHETSDRNSTDRGRTSNIGIVEQRAAY